MKVGVLTSSRADYGIYVPLLNQLKTDDYFQIEIIAFGTHLSENHGHTIKHIEADGFKTIHKIDSLEVDDSPHGISMSYGKTVIHFADFWKNNRYDIVFCLGDRFEMSAAVQASIPFGVPLAHIHGGETTLGAIDNVYRHQITLASVLHFVSTQGYKHKVEQLTGHSTHSYDVGALSLDGIKAFVPIDKSELLQAFHIQDKDFALVTFHPETVDVESNAAYAMEMYKALAELANHIQIVITMPNADTLGSVFREQIHKLKAERAAEIVLVENFGKTNYFSAMQYSKLLIGNTSSGIIEAASFKKYVVNVGSRQKGRTTSDNVFDVQFDANAIVKKTKAILEMPEYVGENVYYKAGTAQQIIKIIKQYGSL
ncbi:GDP/UDP-N,N'-diacetylbacillosamine 2-epimerase (hydrolysing) [Formosa sp. Hel1_31_208]|uniref:UDP-N-acetylglucosamine 2-epimerase n=1 Tax=Formosa sp. Hel1_31_208 TaxID=1798225 RepID=UPI00087DAA1D|nr:UDP-N-acetylglucosamine 2-epimerase [Formosa sp. Hel1_31_208]SDR91575.1 GDP/UDP-N,N'-diacetylbacillosamine 2-epimerase (hydrolysing) [Formosa sp. Hel1_31_208]